MSDEITAGDIVRLKSGGPEMTVAQTGETSMSSAMHAWCDWFVNDKAPWKKETDVFPLTSLVKVRD